VNLFHDAGPRVFHIPPYEDFAAAFAAGLKSRLPDGAPPEAMARVLIFVNARRAARSLSDAIQSESGSQGFAPRIQVLGELGSDPRFAQPALNAVDPMTRKLRLARIVRDILEQADGKLGPPTAAPALADLVASLVDELQEHDVDIDALEDVAEAEHAAHWRVSRLVLQTAQAHWRDWADANLGGALDPAERQRRAVDAQVAAWTAAPPEFPVIAAGSTASRPGAARLLRAIARLPQGAVILPGLDTGMDEDARRNMTSEHPQAAMLSFVCSLDMSLCALHSWSPRLDTDASGQARARLAAEALRPAPVTDAWRAMSDRITDLAPAATEGLTLIEAPDSRREAEAAALAALESLANPNKRVAIVTPDRTLARRIAAELARAGVEVDDSGGRPLSLTPPGVFLRLLADWAAEQAEGRGAALGFLALLKHPMSAAGAGRGAHLKAVRALEIGALRRSTPAMGFDALRRAMADWADERDGRAERAEAALAALDPIEHALAPLAAVKGAIRPLAEHVAALRQSASALSALGAGKGDEPALWRDADGQAVLERLSALESAAGAYGDASAHDLAQLLSATLAAESAREPVRAHPRLAIYGPLEARLQRADRVILAGLDEGVWPEPPQLDPWFSRPMRQTAGLPEMERRLGLSAHDFAQNMGAPEVVLTRALKRDGAATVASRWVQRLTSLLKGAAPEALESMRLRGQRLLCIAASNTWTDRLPWAPRPCPFPPLEARPRRLSVTRIETLIRDPYAIYAEKVLGLRALDPIARAPDMRERGTIAHKAFELFSLALRDEPEAVFDRIWEASIAEALADLDGWPAQQALWSRRLERVAPWFLTAEAERQATGATVGIEISGGIDAPRPSGSFRLTAKADRIDLISGEGYAIYDYKTGAAPSDKQVAAFAKQLPLEAAIAEAGGFEGLPPRPVAKLAYLRIGGEGEERWVDRKTPATEQAAEAFAQFQRLIAAYDDPATPYLSRARPESIRHASDYDHLARVAEWSANDGEEGA